MYAQGASVRASGKVYPSDADLYLKRAAKKWNTDPEGLRVMASMALLDLKTGKTEWPLARLKDEAARRLLADIGIDPELYLYREQASRAVTRYSVRMDQRASQSRLWASFSTWLR